MQSRSTDQIEQGKHSIGYGVAGALVPVEYKDCFAKQVTDLDTGNSRFYIKRAISGREKGNLHNPHSPFFNPRETYAFSKVPKESFDEYLQFLKTDNEVHVRHAERMANNAS